VYRAPADNTSFTIEFVDDKPQPQQQFEINWQAIAAWSIGVSPWIALILMIRWLS
jgi:hypothetical protein